MTINQSRSVTFPPPIRTSIPASEFRYCLKAGNMNRFGLHLRCAASKLIRIPWQLLSSQIGRRRFAAVEVPR